MDFWLKRWIRRIVGEAAQAGLYDAFVAENGAPELTTEQAAAAFREILSGAGAAAPRPPSLADAPTPPQLAGPTPSSTGEPTDQVRRGPGRPRKHQEPPQ
jgi:hypothetical protein